jgi:hypothetical protein
LQQYRLDEFFKCMPAPPESSDSQAQHGHSARGNVGPAMSPAGDLSAFAARTPRAVTLPIVQ